MPFSTIDGALLEKCEFFLCVLGGWVEWFNFFKKSSLPSMEFHPLLLVHRPSRKGQKTIEKSLQNMPRSGFRLNCFDYIAISNADAIKIL